MNYHSIRHMRSMGCMRLLVMFCLVLGMSVPAIVLAHPGHTQDELLTSYCTRLLVFEVQDEKKITDIETAYAAKEKVRTDELQKIRNRQIKSFDENNAKIKKEAEELIQKMKSGSDNPKEIEKISILESKLFTALENHNKKVLEAEQAYLSGINDLIVARKSAFVTAKNIFKTESARILKQSKADCAAKTDVNKIFANTTTGLKAAHEVLKNKIARLVTPASLFKKLSDTRDAIIAQAEKDFMLELEQYIAELK